MTSSNGQWFLAALLLLFMSSSATHNPPCRELSLSINYSHLSCTMSHTELVDKPTNYGFMPGGSQVKSNNFTMLQWICASLDPSHMYCLSDVFKEKSRLLVILLLLISGNIESNPGPFSCSNLPTPAVLKKEMVLDYCM